MIERLTLMAGCVARTPFRTQVEAAARAGFQAITTWPNIWRHARERQCLSLRDMRTLLDDNGLVLTEIEGIRDWPPGNETLDVCAELAGQTVVAMLLDPAPYDLAQEVERFVGFAEAAQSRGLRPAIEFVAFGGIADAATAWRVIEQSGSAEAGIVIDLCHHVRSGGDDAALLAIPPERIVSVQIADGPAIAPPDLLEEATYGRMWPGEGAFDISGFVAMLASRGVRANGGLELYHRDFAAREPEEVIRQLAVAGRLHLQP